MDANVDEVQVAKIGTEPMEANVDEALVNNMGAKSMDPILLKSCPRATKSRCK